MAPTRSILPVVLVASFFTVAQSCEPAGDPPLPMPDAAPLDGQTFQRDGASGEIPISLPVAQQHGGVWARVGGGPWQIIDADLGDGRADGVLTGVPVGRHAVEVRHSGGDLLWTATDVGVGDVYVLWGQSNMIMRGATRSATQTGARVLPVRIAAQAPTLFKPAVDSLWYSDPNPVPDGSAWPLVADAITASAGIPIGYVAVAQGATRLAVNPHWAVGRNPWNRMIGNTGVATAGTMRVRAVLGHQGEADAAHGASYAVYKDALCAFGTALAGEFSGLEAFVVAQIGAFPTASPVALEAVRQAQRDAALECPPITAGPVTVDLPIDATGHFGDAAIPELAARWCEALAPLYADTAPLDCRSDL
jgi:hypothetical protein